MSVRLVERAGRVLAARTDRRGFLARAALARQRELLEDFRGAHQGDSSPRVSKFLERMKQLFGS